MSSSIPLGPTPVENSDFLFRRMRLIELEASENQQEDLNERGYLQRLVASTKYGKLFAAGKRCLHFLDVADIESVDNVPKPCSAVKDIAKVSVPLPNTPDHLALNADESVLSVGVKLKSGAPHLYFFDVRAFVSGQAIKPFTEVASITSPGTEMVSLNWNPVMPSMLAVVYSDGGMALFMLNNEAVNAVPDCCTLPPAEGITCLSWSPKGKQLVAGKRNGNLTQYKPDLKEAKTIPPPNGCNFSVRSILWISTYQFLVAFKDNSTQGSRPGLFMVQSSKAGTTTYFNYDDICYSTGELDPALFHMTSISDWNTVICASNNSVELGVLGSCTNEPGFVQWLQNDDGRAELPLSSQKSERYPVGLTVAYNSQRKLEKADGTGNYEHPMPISFVLSADGVLCGHYVINSMANATPVVRPAEPLTAIGMRPGVVNVPVDLMTQSQAATSFSLSTSTPKKVPSSNSEPPASSIFGKSAFAPIKPLETTKIASAPKPTPPSISESNKNNSAPTEVSFKTKQETKQQTTPAKIDHQSSSEKAYKSAILAEAKSFYSYLNSFKQRSSVNIDIGTAEDKGVLKTNVENMERFCSDLKEITLSQTKEISYLQNTVWESLDFAEQAKFREKQNRDPRQQRLQKNRSLDPISQRKLNNIHSKFQFLEQQIQEANHKLDLEWKSHLKQNRGHGLTGRRLIEIPKRETIYQALVTNHRILEQQRVTIKKLTGQIKEVKIKCVSDALDSVSIGGDTQKSFVQDDKMPLESTRREELANSSFNETKLDKVLSPIKTFSPEKEAHLRARLTKRGILRIKPHKPQNLGESRFLKFDITPEVEKTKGLIQSTKEAAEETQPPARMKDTSENNSIKIGTPSAAPISKSLSKTSNPTGFSFSLSSASSGAQAMPGFSNAGSLSITSIPKSGSSRQDLAASEKNIPSTSSPALFSLLSAGSTAESFSSSNKSPGSLLSKPSTTNSPFANVKPTKDLFSTSVATTTASFFSGATKLVTSPAEVKSVPKTSELLTISKVPATTDFTKPLTTIQKDTTGTLSNQQTTKLSASKSPGIPFQSTPKDSSVFGASSAIFGSAAITPAFTTPTTTKSIFGNMAGSSVTSTSQPLGGAASSVFSSLKKPLDSSPAPDSTSTTGFGIKPSVSVSTTATPVAVTTVSKSPPQPSLASPSSSGSVFGTSAPASTVASPSVFGTSAPTSTVASSASVFGTAAPATVLSGSSVFGTSAPASTVASSSVFGTSAPASTVASSSVFGTSTPASTVASSSVFGTSVPASTVASSSVFGTSAPASTVTSSASVFGTATTNSVFGAPSNTGSVFNSPPVSTSISSPFGKSTSGFGSNSSAIFGNSATQSSENKGSPASATAPTTTFGVKSSTPFGSVATPDQPGVKSTSGSVFGTPTLGATSSTFGNPTTLGATSTSSFGTTTSVANPSVSSQGSVFGTASAFGSSLSFGSQAPSTGFGSKPAASIFGGGGFGSSSASPQTATTTSTTTFGGGNSNLFGGSSGSFGSATPASPFTSPSGTTSPFGNPSQPSGFGTSIGSSPSAAFGGPPSFGSGSQSTFGGAAAFGASPTFGSGASPTFGSGTSPTFGSGAGTMSSSTTFGNSASFGALAQDSNVPTFGALSQQSGSSFGGTAQQGGFGGASASPPLGGTTPFGSSPQPKSPSFSAWR